jgi:hypothetical protein
MSVKVPVVVHPAGPRVCDNARGGARREKVMASRAGTTEQDVGSGAPPRTAREFDLLFARAYPAAVGLARRVLDRDQVAPEGSGALTADIATEALTRARVQRLRDTDGSLRRIMGWTADLCVGHLVGHPGRVALPVGARAEDLLPADLLEDGVGAEWGRRGLPLDELQVALTGMGRRGRRVGLVCLGAGLTPPHTAALLGIDLSDVRRRLDRIGVRLADLRRVDADLAGPLDGPGEEVA